MVATEQTRARPEGVSRSEWAKLQTRQRIVDAAVEFLGADHVAHLQVTKLAEAADVALGTFYNHFADIDELMDAVIDHQCEDLCDNVCGLDDRPVSCRVDELMGALEARCLEDAAWCSVWLNMGNTRARASSKLANGASLGDLSAFWTGAIEGVIDSMWRHGAAGTIDHDFRDDLRSFCASVAMTRRA